jgi:hypothetical protein
MLFCFPATTERVPTIKNMHFNLSSQSVNTQAIILDKTLGIKRFWTKYTNLTEVSLQVSAYYQAEIDTQNMPNYISSYHIGIEELQIVSTLRRGTCKYFKFDAL